MMQPPVIEDDDIRLLVDSPLPRLSSPRPGRHGPGP